MSYILDALKRAEAQRERGAVPGIHAQAGSGLAAAGVQRRNARMVWWCLAGIALVCAAVLAWVLAARDTRRDAVRNVVATVPPPALAPAVTTPVASPPAVTSPGLTAPGLPAAAEPAVNAPPAARPVAAPQPSSQAPAAAQAPTATVQPARTAPATQQPPPRTAASTAAAGTVRQGPASAAAAATTPAAIPAAPDKPAAPQEPRIYAREELPADIRAQLPPLTVNGSTYSANPAHRLLIANGQVFHENERITADLAVEQIGVRSAVLSFRGYRFLLPF